MRRTGTFSVAAAAASVALVCGAPSMLSARSAAGMRSVNRGQVVERCGMTGELTIGRPIPGAERLRHPGIFTVVSGPGVGPDVMVTTADDRIVEIKLSRPGVFTQRYVVIGETKLNDVLKRYGAAQPRQQRARSALNPRDLVVDYAYEGISFVFSGMPQDLSPSASRPAPASFDKPVSALLLYDKEKDPAGRDHSCGLASAK